MEYKNRIIETLGILSEVREKTLLQIINLAMENELKEINDAFDIGEGFTFELSHFEGLTDSNVQQLVALCKNIEGTYFNLMDLNGINEAEIEKF